MNRSIRGIAVRLVLIFALAHAGGSLANMRAPAGEATDASAGPNAPLAAPLTRAESAVVRFLPASLRTRITFASGGVRRGATQEKDAIPGAGGKRASAAPRPRSGRPVITTAATGPGQSGYVHYFVIDTPDGERETQIGIELPDGRIAWSFPELGVVVSPFIESGELQANGRAYKVQHLYGIRPFPDDESMLVLKNELLHRVIPWVEDGTPHCNLATRSNQLCLSCLGFVMRVLYPSRSGNFAALPPDFEGSSSGLYITTEDLLLYQTGLHGMLSKEARLKRIDGLELPQNLREDLMQLANSMEVGAPAARPGKKRTGARSHTKPGPQPLPQGKKL